MYSNGHWRAFYAHRARLGKFEASARRGYNPHVRTSGLPSKREYERNQTLD